MISVYCLQREKQDFRFEAHFMPKIKKLLSLDGDFPKKICFEAEYLTAYDQIAIE